MHRFISFLVMALPVTLAFLARSPAFAQPLLNIYRHDAGISVDLSTNLTDWITVTNIETSAPNGFFRQRATVELPFDFNFQPAEIRAIPFSQEFYAQNYTEPLPDKWQPQDENGVRLFRAADGKAHNHPVLQSEWGLMMYNGYTRTGNSAYLELAEKHAQRLIDTRMESRGGWYYPYPFEFQLAPWPGDNRLQPPWFDAMAQGQSLALFVKLYRLVGKEIYKEAADKTFKTFQIPYREGEPWVVRTDEEGFLWFEHYPNRNGESQYVYNGHIFALFGVWDYFILTQDPTARRLVEAGLTTVKRWTAFFRTPNWVIKYSRAHEVLNPNYQQVVARELLMLYSITADPFFARAADDLLDDYPVYSIYPNGTLSGGITGHQFDSVGRITNSISALFATPTKVRMASRMAIFQQAGVWLKVDAGELAGFWVKEAPPQAEMNCIHSPVTYSPSRKLFLRNGAPSYTFAKYNNLTGVAEQTMVKDFPATAADGGQKRLPFECNGRAWINSRPHLRISGGELDGFWVEQTARLRLD